MSGPGGSAPGSKAVCTGSNLTGHRCIHKKTPLGGGSASGQSWYEIIPYSQEEKKNPWTVRGFSKRSRENPVGRSLALHFANQKRLDGNWQGFLWSKSGAACRDGSTPKLDKCEREKRKEDGGGRGRRSWKESRGSSHYWH